MKTIVKHLSLVLVMMVLAMPGFAEDRIELEKGSIIGNRESPKAIYIVPWRPLTPVDIKGLEIETLLDEELELLDPETFNRQLELYELSHSK